MACGATHPINVDEIRLADAVSKNPNLHVDISVKPDPCTRTNVLPDTEPEVGSRPSKVISETNRKKEC
jgi:hypothetical protein